MPTHKGHTSAVTIFLLLLQIYSVAAAFYPATAPEISISGRHYLINETVNYDWPCFRIAFCFESATKVEWQGKDTWNYYSIVLDGNAATKVKPGRSTRMTVFQSKNPESHCV